MTLGNFSLSIFCFRGTLNHLPQAFSGGEMLVGGQKYASLRALGTPAGMLVMVLQSVSGGEMLLTPSTTISLSPCTQSPDPINLRS